MITRVIENISTASGWVAGVAVYGISIVIFIDVILRYFFSTSILVADELSVYFMIFVAFIGAAVTMKKGAHIKVDIIYKRLGKKTRLWLNAVTTVLGAIICSIMTWQCTLWVIYTYQTNFISPGILETRMWIPMACIPIGLFLWTLQYFVQSIKALKILVQTEG